MELAKKSSGSRTSASPSPLPPPHLSLPGASWNGLSAGQHAWARTRGNKNQDEGGSWRVSVWHVHGGGADACRAFLIPTPCRSHPPAAVVVAFGTQPFLPVPQRWHWQTDPSRFAGQIRHGRHTAATVLVVLQRARVFAARYVKTRMSCNTVVLSTLLYIYALSRKPLRCEHLHH